MTETRRTYLFSLLAVVGVAAAGAAAGALGMPWLMAIPAAALAAPGPTRRLLTRFEFSATLVLVLTVCTIVGTMDYALNVFSSLWFMSLLGLAGLSSLLCLLFRYTAGKGVPYILIHLSIIVILVGGGMKYHMKESGLIDLVEGQSSNEMRVMRDGETTQEVASLPFSVRLDRFKVEFYETDTELFVFRSEEETPSAVIPAQAGSQAAVDGVTVRFMGFKDHPFVPTPGHPPIQMKLAEIELNGEKGFLMEGRPKRAGDLVLMLHKKPGEPKSYQSTLSILDEKGEEVLTRSVVVNDPLVYGGWWLYQSNWDPDNPRYAGILAVKDPGLYVALVGLLMLVAGTLGKIRFRRSGKGVAA